MRYLARLCFSVLVAVSCATSAFGKSEITVTPFNPDSVTVPLIIDPNSTTSVAPDSMDSVYHEHVKPKIIPMIYGRSDINIKEAFVETGADLVVIKVGEGGEVVGMFKTLEYLRVHPDKRVIIDGACYSACTDLLSKSLKEGQVCFTHDAEFGFHSASAQVPKGYKLTPADRKLLDRDARMFNRQQLELFDIALQAWLMDHDAYDSTNLTEIKVEEMEALTHKGCGDGNPLATR